VRSGYAFPLNPRITLGCAPYLGITKSVAGVRGVSASAALRNLFCDSVVAKMTVQDFHHRGAENTKAAQRNPVEPAIDSDT